MPPTDREALTEAAEPLHVDVPEYIYETPSDVHTDWIIGSALEDGREAGDTRHELQRRVAAYLAAARRLRSPSDRGGDALHEIDWNRIGRDRDQRQVEYEGHDFPSWEAGYVAAIEDVKRDSGRLRAASTDAPSEERKCPRSGCDLPVTMGCFREDCPETMDEAIRGDAPIEEPDFVVRRDALAGIEGGADHAYLYRPGQAAYQRWLHDAEGGRREFAPVYVGQPAPSEERRLEALEAVVTDRSRWADVLLSWDDEDGFWLSTVEKGVSRARAIEVGPPHESVGEAIDAAVKALGPDRAPTDEAPEGREEVDRHEPSTWTNERLAATLEDFIDQWAPATTTYKAHMEAARRLRQPEPAREGEPDG